MCIAFMQISEFIPDNLGDSKNQMLFAGFEEYAISSVQLFWPGPLLSYVEKIYHNYLMTQNLKWQEMSWKIHLTEL